ncbi:stealth conserved region 3 domain-containing protein [Nocardioides sp.]|uniref:stealth conserved region 3 domain-containing protein n=1 Tax=Nocardioides sp. TaxID=35761 RepID=UPI003510F12A
MRIAFLVFNLAGMGGTSRSAITQANALAPDHQVRLISVVRSADEPHYAIDPRIEVEWLVDDRVEDAPAWGDLPPLTARALHERESTLVPARWDRQFTALCDLALEARLPRITEDVVITVTPGLLGCAIELTPDAVVVVHQEHRSSNERTSGLEPLLAYAPRADLVALLTPSVEHWFRDQLGPLAPPTVVVPNPLPQGWIPRATLEEPLIMAAGRLVPEKQFGKLIDAFGQVADRIPEWRLRICGDGNQRLELVRQIRKWDLWDRVELPGSLPDLAAEWPKASIVALTSRSEGFPLVLQEAMAAGVPALSFDCPSGPREIIQHEVNGLLVAPQSVAGMAAALLRLATDDELRHRLGTGARHSARQYDPAALAERWTGILSDARVRRGDRGRLASRALSPVPRPDADPTTGLVLGDLTPARARSEALRCAVGAARAATDTWLVVPAHEAESPVVVVPMSARAAYLDALREAATSGTAPRWLSLRDPAENGWFERRGTLADLPAELRHGMTSTLVVEPWPEIEGRASVVGQRCGVEVQFWETDAGGALIAPRRNPYTDRIPAGTATVTTEVDGLEVPTLPLMAAATVTEARFPVDVVYTWVDGADAAWDAAREARLDAVAREARDGGAAAATRASSGRARYVDREELRYSLRSLHLFAPWVRRIHIVTAGQVPDWLDVDHPAIHLVDHREILPASALPTFNSHAIETALHRIEGLAEHFVYFNDDFLLGRPVRPETFFTAGGLPEVFLSAQNVGLTDAEGAPPFLAAAWNNRRLLERDFGAVVLANLAHAPYAHRVSVLREVEERYRAEVDATAHHPFRSPEDLSVLSSLAPHLGLLTGRAVVGDLERRGLSYVNISRSDLEQQLRRLTDRQQDFVCLGDHHDHALREERLRAVLGSFLTDYYPVAAPWERTTD